MTLFDSLEHLYMYGQPQRCEAGKALEKRRFEAMLGRRHLTRMGSHRDEPDVAVRGQAVAEGSRSCERSTGARNARSERRASATKSRSAPGSARPGRALKKSPKRRPYARLHRRKRIESEAASLPHLGATRPNTGAGGCLAGSAWSDEGGRSTGSAPGRPSRLAVRHNSSKRWPKIRTSVRRTTAS